nr:immunoglobulin heavy chain junction region [Mus musculus]
CVRPYDYDWFAYW